MQSSLELDRFASAREALLSQIVTTLQADERFIAAWLTGSLGRCTGDAVSDLDLRVIVSTPAAEELCQQPWPHGPRTTPARLALFTQFGPIAFVHDSHGNAPADSGGTFTYVLYTASALNVDWLLVPEATAQRGPNTLLLFEKHSLPQEKPPLPESLEERISEIEMLTSFFWMLACECAKPLVRHELSGALLTLDNVAGVLKEVQRLLAGQTWHFPGHAAIPALISIPEAANHLHALGKDMQALLPSARGLGCNLPSQGLNALEARLALIPDRPDTQS